MFIKYCYKPTSSSALTNSSYFAQMFFYKPKFLTTHLFVVLVVCLFFSPFRACVKVRWLFYLLQNTSGYKVLQCSRLTDLKSLKLITPFSYVTQVILLHGMEFCVKLVQFCPRQVCTLVLSKIGGILLQWLTACSNETLTVTLLTIVVQTFSVFFFDEGNLKSSLSFSHSWIIKFFTAFHLLIDVFSSLRLHCLFLIERRIPFSIPL